MGFIELFIPRELFYSNCHANVLLFPFFFYFSAPTSQLQDVSLGQEETTPQVEVSPELDLEVVPESTGDWQNVFP